MPQKPSKSADPAENYAQYNSLKAFLHIVYGLFVLSPFVGGVSFIIALILAYIKRGESVGTIFESHFDYVISSAWKLLLVIFAIFLASIVVLIFSLILIFPAFLWWPLLPFIGVLVVIWYLYRMIKGWLCLFEDREIPINFL